VLGRTRKPVAVLVDRGLHKVERVLVAFSGAPEDLAALKLAYQLGSTPAIEVTLLHVVDPARPVPPAHDRSELDELWKQVATLPRVNVRTLQHGSPTDAVLQEAAAGHDLVVVGINARWGLGGGLFSAGRQRILAETTVSVLAIHPPLDAVTEPASVADTPMDVLP
jgi:nucleotide-binding universal stress UspA family protein